MKKRINLLYMIMALVTIVASVSIACTVFYNVLKHEVLEDMHNYIDVFIGADAWGMVAAPLGKKSNISQWILERRMIGYK